MPQRGQQVGSAPAGAVPVGVRVGVRLEEWVAPAVATVLAVWLVLGRYRGEGPVLVALGASHGVHAGDLLVAVLWLVAVVPTAWRVLRRTR